MIFKKTSACVAAFLAFAAAAFAQSGPGPGPTPSPWVVNGPTISYSNGGVLVGVSVPGGTKGPGTINAQGIYVNGVAVGGGSVSSITAGVGLTGGTITSSGTIALANPSPTTIGGVESFVAVPRNFLTGISTLGVPTSTQPGFTDLLGSATAAQMPAFTGDATASAGTANLTLATVNSNVGAFQGLTINGKGLVTAAVDEHYITSAGAPVQTVFGRNGNVVAATNDYAFPQISGTVGANQLPLPGPASLGGVFSKAAISHDFLTSINSSDGSVGQARPLCADLSDSTAACSTAIGTSGATIPLLNGNNTWGGSNGFQGVTSTTDAIGGCALVSNALCVTGSSGFGNLTIGAGSAITSSGPGGALASGAFTAAYTLPVAQVASLGGVFSKAAVTHDFLTSISSTDGSIGQARPACADLSDSTAACSTAIGTSGATIPLLNGANSWSAQQTFIAPILGTPASVNLANATNLSLTTGVTGVLPSANGGAGTINGLIKANGSGLTSHAVAGTDYAAPTSGSSILFGNGAGGFSNVTVGAGLSFSGGTLSATSVSCPAGSTGYVQYNSAGACGADNEFTYVPGTGAALLQKSIQIGNASLGPRVGLPVISTGLGGATTTVQLNQQFSFPLSIAFSMNGNLIALSDNAGNQEAVNIPPGTGDYCSFSSAFQNVNTDPMMITPALGTITGFDNLVGTIIPAHHVTTGLLLNPGDGAALSSNCANWNAVFYPSVIPAIVPSSTLITTEVDSRTSVNEPIEPYPNLYFDSNPTNLLLFNEAQPGDTITFSATGREASDGALVAANPGKSHYIYTLWGGANDYGGFSLSPTAVAATAGTVCTAMKGYGYTTVIATEADFGADAASEAWRATFNSAITALVPGTCDYLLDLGSDYVMGPAGVSLDNNTFQGHLHMTVLGQKYLERHFARVINGILAGAVVPGNPTELTALYAKSTSLWLAWVAPISGGYYNDYILQYGFHGSGIWTTFSHTAGQATQAFIPGLTPNTSYDVRVAQVSSVGQSAGYATLTVATPATDANTIDAQTLTSGVSLLNANMSALSEQGGTWRTNLGKAAGKWYVEIRIDQAGITTIEPGVVDETFNQYLPLYLALGTYTNSATGGNGASAVTGFTAVNTVIQGPYVAGDIIMIAFDAGTGQAWLGKNGVWGSSGNPAAGTNPWVTWTGGAYTVHAAVYSINAGAIESYVGPSTTYAPPAGFTALQ